MAGSGHGTTDHAVHRPAVGQAVCDHPINQRHQAILPARIWGDGEPEGVRQRAAAEIADTTRAAAKLGVQTVVGFTGSSIWYLLAMDHPPRTLAAIGDRPAFGLNWDPSHMLWQDLDPAAFILDFPDRIYHVDCKDTKLRSGTTARSRSSGRTPAWTGWWGRPRRYVSCAGWRSTRPAPPSTRRSAVPAERAAG